MSSPVMFQSSATVLHRSSACSFRHLSFLGESLPGVVVLAESAWPMLGRSWSVFLCLRQWQCLLLHRHCLPWPSLFSAVLPESRRWLLPYIYLFFKGKGGDISLTMVNLVLASFMGGVVSTYLGIVSFLLVMFLWWVCLYWFCSVLLGRWEEAFPGEVFPIQFVTEVGGFSLGWLFLDSVIFCVSVGRFLVWSDPCFFGCFKRGLSYYILT